MVSLRGSHNNKTEPNAIQKIIKNIPIVPLLPFFLTASFGQNESGFYALTQTIHQLDSSFWVAYNTCNIDDFKKYITDDIEFYHDIGGLTKTSAALISSIENGLCSKMDQKTRREAIQESVKIYPLNNYGAIISGDHLFYVTEGGRKEKLVGKAKFTHVWQFKDNEWKMSRVLSFDHQRTSENRSKQQVSISIETLLTYVGDYEAPNAGRIIMSLVDGALKIDAGNMKAEIYPESQTVFFHPEAPLTFEFVKDGDGRILKFIVRESGDVVEEAMRVNEK